jgi:hypothetical protein
MKKQEEAALEAKQEIERNQKVIQTKAADEIFSRQIANQIAAKVDPSTMIKAAIPGTSQWGIDGDNNFAMRLKTGDTFTGKDLVKSVYATKQVVTDMLGEGHAAIFDRAFVAPLDPNFRLQQSAKDAVAPFIGEMQKNGSFSENYTEETVGVVQDDINMGVVEKALRYSLERLQDGDNPAPTAIDAMSMVAHSKGFEKYPDAAKHYVLQTVAEKIDLLSNNLTAKVGADVSALFNSIDQETNTVIAGMGVDFDTQELMPVPQNERSGLVREITTMRDEIQKNQQFLIANDGVLSIPWADRKVKEQYQVVSADNDKMKERLAELYKKATRDIPQEKADPVGAALFGIGASAIEWGTDPEKVEKELGGLSQNFAQMDPPDQRKFLAERLINNWYAANSKDPSKAPINAEIRSKMLNAIRTGQKLSPEIEDSLNTVMQNFKVMQQQQAEVDLKKAKIELSEFTNIFSQKVPMLVVGKKSEPIDSPEKIATAREYVNREFQKYGPEIYGKAMEKVDEVEIKLRTKDAQERAASRWLRDKPLTPVEQAQANRFGVEGAVDPTSSYIMDNRAGEVVKTKGMTERGGKRYYLTINNEVIDEDGNFAGKVGDN